MMQSEPKQSELAPYQQLDLWYDSADQGGPPRVLDDMDVSFLHKSFCIAGLPLRAPKNPKEPYTRNDNRFALTIAPNSFMLPGGEMVHVGIPYGPKSRLLAMWMATEVRDHERRPDNRWLEIGRVTHWLRSIGVEPVSGRRGSLNAVKDQLVRLAFSQFTMVMKNGTVGDTMFKSDRLIESSVFEDGDFELYLRGDLGKMAWPKGIELSERAFDRFRKYSIPVPTARLAKIAHSAMAIDIFAFLCYRLPHLSPRETELVTWRQLISQFGSGETPSKFRETFEASIRCALDAYPEANVDLRLKEGLLMRWSDPAELRRAFFVVPTLPAPETSSLSPSVEGTAKPVRNFRKTIKGDAP
jgi:hypothetical protein